MFHGANQSENKQTQAVMQKREGIRGKAAKRNKIKLHAILQCSARCFLFLPAFAFHTVQIAAPYTFLMNCSWDPNSKQHPIDRVAEVHLHSPGFHLTLA